VSPGPGPGPGLKEPAHAGNSGLHRNLQRCTVHLTGASIAAGGPIPFGSFLINGVEAGLLLVRILFFPCE
jgi:hypothetical protein